MHTRSVVLLRYNFYCITYRRVLIAEAFPEKRITSRIISGIKTNKITWDFRNGILAAKIN